MHQDRYDEYATNNPLAEPKLQPTNLSNSENWENLILEGIEEALFSLDKEWRFTYLNQQTARLWGRSKESLLGKSLWEEFPTLHGSAFERFYRQTMADSKPGQIEELSLTTQRWYEVRVYPISQGLIIYFQDISVKKELEQSLRASEYRFKVLSEASFEGVVIHQNGIAVEANQSAAQLYGYSSPEELIGVSIVQHLTPESRTTIQHWIAEGLEEPYEVTVIRKDGTHLPVEGRSKAIEYRGQRARVVTGRDITNRKRQEEQLRESEARFKTAFEFSGIGMALINLDGSYLQVNQALCRMLGYSEAELLQTNFASITHPDDLESDLEHIVELLTNQAYFYEIEKRYLHKNGSSIWVQLTRSLVRDSLGQPWYFISQVQNITARKQAEEALRKTQAQLLQAQKMEGIGRLAGGISHDFNNILTAIIGYSEIALYSFTEEDPLYEDLSEIVKASQRATELTRQLLVFSRQQVLQPRVVNLNQMVTDMDKLLHRLIGEDIEILSVPDQELGEVLADPGQIEQVIMNLAVNARDAMSGGGRLTIETANAELDEHYHAAGHPTIKAGSYVMLAVSDTGTGMDQATQQKIFEPFFTTKEVGQGTGLGLATVYGIVEQSEGYIMVYSEVGVGTTFKIYLPRVKSLPLIVEASTGAASTFQSQTSSEPPELDLNPNSGNNQLGTRSKKDRTVLVVEDEELVRNLIHQVLVSAGYKVLRVTNGQEAMELLVDYSDQIDVVLTDIIMPKMGGRELVNQLKARWPNLKVICMSGYTDRAVVRHELLQRCDNFLQKPFTPQILLNRVGEVLVDAKRS